MTSSIEAEDSTVANAVATLFMRICREYQRVTWPLASIGKAGAGSVILDKGMIILTLTYLSIKYSEEDNTLEILVGNYNEHTNYGLPMAKSYVTLPVEDDVEFTIRSALTTVVSSEYIGEQGAYIDPIVEALLSEDNDHVPLPFGKNVPEHLYDINFLVDYMNHRIFV